MRRGRRARSGRMMFCPRSLSFVSVSEVLERLNWMIGHIGRAVAQHQRRRDVARHVLHHHQRAAGKLRDRAAHIGTLVQIDLDDTDAVVAGGLDPGDIVDQRGHLPLWKVRMRFWISSALIPLYVHTTLTTGMLISGKMSVGIRLAAPPAKRHTSAIIAKTV